MRHDVRNVRGLRAPPLTQLSSYYSQIIPNSKALLLFSKLF